MIDVGISSRGAALAAALLLAAGGAAAQSVGGGSVSPANGGLKHCDDTLGVLRIEEDIGSNWYRYYGPRLGSTAPLLSMLIMQSNCFVVVERGTGERGIAAETARARGDEARESDTRGKGQQVVADYLMKPEIVLANPNSGGGNLGGIGRLLPGALGALAGGMSLKQSEVGTVLTPVDIRSTVRLAAAEGYSKNTDFSFGGIGLGSGGALGGSAYTNDGRRQARQRRLRRRLQQDGRLAAQLQGADGEGRARRRRQARRLRRHHSGVEVGRRQAVSPFRGRRAPRAGRPDRGGAAPARGAGVRRLPALQGHGPGRAASRCRRTSTSPCGATASSR